MSIETTRNVRAGAIEEGQELDLDGDEFGDNEMAIFAFAVVDEVFDYKDSDGDRWVRVSTSQGEIDFPVSHWVKVKVVE